MTALEFDSRLISNFQNCQWIPHPKYSVFTQWDADHYLKQKDEFTRKYQWLWAISKTINPTLIIELGACAGSGADAYLSATPNAEYIGIDIFGRHQLPSGLWDPQEVATDLLSEKGFNFRLIQSDLREIKWLDHAELVAVDAAHDRESAYADLMLAMTSQPDYILFDDSDDNPGLRQFMNERTLGQIEFTVRVNYIGGGLIIKMKL